MSIAMKGRPTPLQERVAQLCDPYQGEEGANAVKMLADEVGRVEMQLSRRLGPVQVSPTPACADKAGTPVVSTVSTETAGEQLKRMKQREAAIWRELEIYLPIVDALKAAASDLDEAIKRLEKEVEG